MRLELPLQIHAENRITEPRRDAPCILLARFTFPKRYSDLHLEFGWKPERVSRITSVLCRVIVHRWQHLLTFDHHRLTPRKLREYANIIRKKAIPLHNWWGIVDGTVRPIARPVRMQRTVYNGHRRVHALKYHAIVTPDGIIAHFYEPVEGRRHDKVLWNESRVMDHRDAVVPDSPGHNWQQEGRRMGEVAAEKPSTRGWRTQGRSHDPWQASSGISQRRSGLRRGHGRWANLEGKVPHGGEPETR